MLQSLVDCSVENVKTLKEFMVILLVLVPSFSFALHELLAKRHWIGVEADSFDSYGKSLLTGFDMMMGNYDSTVFISERGAAPHYWEVSMMLFLGFMAIITVIMMNLLIASMEQTYERVLERRYLFMLKLRAEKILWLEAETLSYNAHATPPSSFTFNLKIALASSMEYSEYPPYMHVLRRVNASDSGGWNEWPGRMTVMGRKAAQFVEDGPVGTTLIRLSAENTFLRNDIMHMRQEMREVKDDLSQILANMQAGAEIHDRRP